MLKIFTFDKLPAGLNINRMQYSTEAKLKALVYFNFGEDLKDLKVGSDYVIAEVFDDCVSGDDVFAVIKDSVKAIACTYNSPNSSTTSIMDKMKSLITDEKSVETKFGRIGDNILQKSSKLTAPVAVMFKMSELPDGFSGSLHKYGDKFQMLQAIFKNFVGVEIFPDTIESGMYYICAILCEDFKGPITYNYFIKCLRYDKLAAYKFED